MTKMDSISARILLGYMCSQIMGALLASSRLHTIKRPLGFVTSEFIKKFVKRQYNKAIF